MAITKLFSGGPPVWDFEYPLTAVAVGAPVAIEVLTIFLMGFYCINTNAVGTAEITFTFVDTANGEIVDTQPIKPKGILKLPSYDLMKCVGLKAGASGAGLKLRAWGTRGAAS